MATVVVLAVLPATASAAPQWFAEQPISPVGWQIAEVDVDPSGKAEALLSSTGGVAITTRPVGGRFNNPVGLPFVTGAEPQLGIDDAGGAVVAWRSQPSGTLQASSRAAAGAPFTPPASISVSGGFASNLWDLDVGPDGTAAIAWHEGSHYGVRVRPPGGAWGGTEEFDPTAGTSFYLDTPQVRVDGSGRVFVFGAAQSSSASSAQYGEKPPGEALLATKTAIADVGPMPGIAQVSPGGTAALFWNRLKPGPPFNEYEQVVVVRPVGDANFGMPQVIADLGSAGGQALAVNNDGSALAAWQDYSPDGRRSWVSTAARSSSGDLTAPAILSSTAGVANRPAVGVDSSGDAVVLWHQAGAQSGPFPGLDPTHIEAASRPAGESFGQPSAVSSNIVHNTSASAVSASGTAVAIWTGTESGRSCVRAVVRAETSLPGDGRTCASIPQPAVPGTVFDPFTGAPVLSFSGSKTVRLSSPVIGVRASCNEACVLSASGKVTTTGASKTLRLKGAKTKLLPAGKRVTLKLKLSKKSYRSLRRALKKGVRAKALLKVTARDAGGAKRTFKRTLKLKRSR